MSIQITRRDIESAIEQIGLVRGQASAHSSKGEYVAGTLASQAESGLAAFGYGCLEGAYGPVRIMNVHADLAAALALHAAGIFGLFGKHAGHAHNFAQGLADGYLARLGMGTGAKYANDKSGRPFQATSGPSFQVSGTRDPRRPRMNGAAAISGERPRPMTTAEIAAAAQQIR